MLMKYSKMDLVCIRVLTFVHSKWTEWQKHTHTQSKLGSGNSRLRQTMKEECNILIRREQVPQATNRFVRLLSGPCSLPCQLRKSRI